MTSEPSSSTGLAGNSTGERPPGEHQEIARSWLTPKAVYLRDQHGPDSYVFEYSLKQGAAHVSPLKESLERISRGGANFHRTGYLPIGYYSTREEAGQAAEDFCHQMELRGIRERVNIRTLKASSRNRKKRRKNTRKNPHRKKK